MSNNMKSMPYKLLEGGIEQVKMRCHAAISRAEAEGRARRQGRHRWTVASAMAAVAIAIICVIVVPNIVSDPIDGYIAELQESPSEIVYELSMDAIEYSDFDDMNLLLN